MNVRDFIKQANQQMGYGSGALSQTGLPGPTQASIRGYAKGGRRVGKKGPEVVVVGEEGPETIIPNQDTKKGKRNARRVAKEILEKEKTASAAGLLIPVAIGGGLGYAASDRGAGARGTAGGAVGATLGQAAGAIGGTAAGAGAGALLALRAFKQKNPALYKKLREAKKSGKPVKWSTIERLTGKKQKAKEAYSDFRRKAQNQAAAGGFLGAATGGLAGMAAGGLGGGAYFGRRRAAKKNTERD